MVSKGRTRAQSKVKTLLNSNNIIICSKVVN